MNEIVVYEAIHVIGTTIGILSPFIFLAIYVVVDDYVIRKLREEEAPPTPAFKRVEVISKAEAYMILEAEDHLTAAEIGDDVIYLN